ncbi:MAG TPA: HD domain-containing phosphohydrolase [Thermoanaerobaculia bacterium]
MSPPDSVGFRRVLFHGQPPAEWLRRLPSQGLQMRPFAAGNFGLTSDEIGLVVADGSLGGTLASPPPANLGEGADRIAVLLIGEWMGAVDPFWSARALFSLPRSASDEDRVRAVTSLFRIVEERAVSARARRALAHRTQEIEALVDVGMALTAEQDHDRLLELILSRARALTQADAGALYLLEKGEKGDVLRFVKAQNDSVRFDFSEIAGVTLPLDDSSIAGFVARVGQPLNLPDVYALPPGVPYRFDPSFDKRFRFRSRSNLAVPMKTPQGRTIGVFQLLNRLKRSIPDATVTAVMKIDVVPFDEANVELATSFAAQAAVAIENRRLTENIKRLFEGFVEASVTAIEQRDPTTSGHSERVALLSCRLAELADRQESGSLTSFHITREELRELRYAAVLHDFGKVGVREQVLVKARKLPPLRKELIRSRVEQAILSAAADTWERAAKEKWTERKVAEALAERVGLLEKAWKVVSRADEPSLLAAEVSAEIGVLHELQFRDASGAMRPLLEEEELGYLSIPKGSLNDRERREIESHVTQTFRFLSKIPWTPDLSRVPDWAYAHHEKLDGSGYPRKLKAPELPVPVRVVTISDIYDALAARDRPYKKAVPDDRALDILRLEARRGVIDSDLLELFIGGEVYRAAPQKK